MQNKVNQDPGYVLLSIPLDMLEEAHIDDTQLLHYSAGHGKIVIETVHDTGDVVCAGNCGDCPLLDGCPHIEELI